MTGRKRATRTCDAPGCSVEVPRGKLMCREHWFALPRELRGAINETWKARQIRAWSENCLSARNFIATNARRCATLRDRILGEETLP